MKNKYTYMTLLGSDNYLKGTLALIKSLELQNTKYPITVLVTDNVSDRVKSVLDHKHINYIIADKVNISDNVRQRNIKSGFTNWSNTFSKLLIFGMTQFDKIVFLDSDMMVLKNLDHLFRKPHLSAVVAGKTYPGNEEWKDLNSGIMVIVPKEEEDKKLINSLENLPLKNGFGDQDVLQAYYPSWKKDKSLHLEEEYNVFAKYEPYFLSTYPEKEIKVLHFVGKVKPWNMSKKQEYIYKLKVVKDQLKNNHSLKESIVSLTDFNKYKSLCKLVFSSKTKN